ncbi:U-box domain-containing protein 33-like [Ananas comosus]|uniref:RING-type E3 ubiquitin transferase n=2 Tax=Ananas comosus TaxID=4615 RepID=A0A6P5GXR6_ANACO|nr:U-box domain-containing protein 33-like [Ananas comosus]
MYSRRDGSSRDTEEAIYVTLGKEFKKDSTNLSWVLVNFPTARIVFLHVHWPSKWMPFMGGKVSHKLANEQEQELHRRNERNEMLKLMCRYKRICTRRKVKLEYVNDENVLRGIINLVKTFRVKRLVTASRSMSKQAELLECCQIWLVRDGNHISTSGAIREDTETKVENEESQELSIPALEPLTNESEAYAANESEAYATPSSDLDDEIPSDQDEIHTLTDRSLCHSDVSQKTETTVRENESPSESNTTTDESGGEMFSEEAPDRPVKHKSFRNDAAEVQLLWAEVKQLKREVKKLKIRLKNESSIASKGKAVFSEQKLKGVGDNPNPPIPEHVTEFSHSELKRATNNFNRRNIIGEGGYGPVYRGKLRGAVVAIKMLNPKSKQGHPEFQQEVHVLGMIKNPYIIKLMGVCSKSCSLVYEYLPSGTLKQQLVRALSWQDRVRILGEQRSALICLHTNKPYAIIHADLKPQNILLDENNISRLGDFGTARAILNDPSNQETICRKTNPMGTTGYMDPIFLMTGELTPQSDVYSYGVVTLQLLTGLLELNIAEQVEEGLRRGVARQILDGSAGDWPAVQAEKLLRLALRCCSLERKQRPSLESKEWRTLDILRAMAGKSRKLESTSIKKGAI